MVVYYFFRVKVPCSVLSNFWCAILCVFVGYLSSQIVQIYAILQLVMSANYTPRFVYFSPSFGVRFRVFLSFIFGFYYGSFDPLKTAKIIV